MLPFCSFCLLAITPPPAGHHRVALSISAPVNKNHCEFHPSAITIAISDCAFQSVHSTHRQSTVAISACVSSICVSNHSSLCVPPTTSRFCAFYFYTSERKSFLQSHNRQPSQSVLVDSMVCIPLCASILFVLPAGNPPMQSVRVCPASASATTVHCVFHLPQADFVLSISTPVNENHFCSPHNRQPDRNQCLWIHGVHSIMCFHFVRSACWQSPQCNLIAISACGFHGVHSIMCFHFVRSACWQSPQCNQCLCVLRPYQCLCETTIQSVLHLSAITELRFLFLHQ